MQGKSSAVLPRIVRSASCAAAFVLLASAIVAPAVAQDATKELLGKAQSQSESKAVEDLIGKLNRRAKPAQPASAKPTQAEPAKPAVEPAKQPPEQANPAEQQPKPAETEQARPVAPKPVPAETSEQAKPATGAGTDADSTAKTTIPAPETTTTVTSAEAEDMPSVDLEVLFEYNSARIAKEATATLTTLGRALTDARLADDFFLIAGHTDAKGGADYNVRLSQQRADAVRRFLIDSFRIDGNRLVARGFGSRRLKVPADPLAAANRRVQIVNFTPPKR